MIVTAKKHNNKLETRSIVTNKIQTELITQTEKIKRKKDGSVIINCEHNKDVSRSEEMLQSRIGEDFDILGKD